MFFRWLRSVLPTLDKIPGPPRLPVPIGNMLQLVGARREHSMGFLWKQHEWAREYGPIYRMIVGPRPMVTVTDPHMVKEVVKNDPAKYTKGDLYSHLGPWFGGSILLSEGEEWRAKRRAMTPAFAAKALRKFVPVYLQSADELLQYWFGQKGSGPHNVEITDAMTRVTLEVIGRCAFGYPMNTMQPEQTRFATEVENVLDSLSKRELSVAAQFVSIDTFMKHFTAGKKYAAAIEYMKSFADDVVAERVEQKKRGELTEENAKDLLSIILDVNAPGGEEISGEDCKALRQEVLLFFFAGHETTSNMLSWALYYIYSRDELLQRVTAEIEEHIPPGQDPTYDDLNKLEFTSCLLKEVLRLHSPAAGFIRETKCEVELGGYTIPPKVPVFVSSYSMHRNPEYWENPDEFNPERFLPENSKGRSSFAWAPFAVGARNCIGMQFAMVEARAILSRLIPRVKLAIEEEPSNMTQLLMKPTPYHASVELR